MKKIFKNFGFTRYIRAVLAVLSASVMLLGIQAGAYAMDYNVWDTDSLKYAINFAGSGDTIIFDDDIQLTDDLPLFMTDGVIINGNGKTLDGMGTYSLLQFEQSRTPGTISDLTIMNGINDNGGAIFVWGDLSKTGTISGSTFSGNEATNGHGGAIYAETLSGTISNSIFSGNTAGYDGGAIYVNQDLSGNISNSTFSNNTVTNGSGGAIGTDNFSGTISDSTFSGNEATNGHGGAIWTDTLSGTILNSEFTGNTAMGIGSQGGAIWANTLSGTIEGAGFINNSADALGGAIYANTLSGKILNSEFSGNTADGGGAIFVWNDLSGTISNSEFSDNKATNGRGGAIFVQEDLSKTGTISGSIFSNNTATINGGAIYVNQDLIGTISNSIFSGNTASYGGGAIYVRRDLSGTTSDSTFSGNKVTSYGGAIQAGTLSGTISNSIFSDNEATNGEGGAIYADTLSGTISNSIFSDNEAHGRGGAIYAPRLSGTISNSTFSGNKAMVGGAIWARTLSGTISNSTFSNNTATGEGGAIHADTLSGTILNSTFSNNTTNGEGGAIYADTLSGAISNSTFTGNTAMGIGSQGGAIWVDNDLSGTILNSTFEGNKAGDGGAIWVDNDLSGTILNSTFSGNEVVDVGGAIFADILSGTISNSIFEGNKADGGGAIFTLNLSGAISNSIFSGNKAMVGGAIGANTLSGTISGSKFEGNKADLSGGAIYTPQLSGNISNSIFSGNTAANGSGGAIQAGTLSGAISNSIFSDNTATNGYGGAIYAGTLSGKISSSTFSGNKAESGGGIYVWDELSGNITNSIFTNNTATNGSGGAIGTDNFSGTISNSIFSNNTTTNRGGAIFTLNLSGIIEDTSFINNSTDMLGGAIWTGEGSNFTIAAINNDVVFSGNTAGIAGNDIYLEGSAAQQTVLNLNTNSNRWIYFNGGIATTDDVTITQDGNVYFDAPVDFQGNLNTAYNFTNGILKLGKESYLDGANFHLGAIGGGTDGNCLIDLRNGAFGTMNPVSLTLAGDTNLVLGIDADLIKGKTDTFSAGSFNNNGNSLNIAFVSNIINDREGTTIIPLGNVLLNPDIISGTSFSDTTAMGRILKYNVSAGAEGDALTYTQTGFNPAILASPVAATAGTLAIQMNTFREAFNNMDRLMNMSRNARFALKNQNRTAISEATTDAPFRLYTSRDEGSTWYRPHISIEKVNLKGAKGSSVNNTTYGAYFGGDMQMKELKNGWDVVHSAYGGYTGAHQTFEGIGNYQNGAALGVASTFYKNDFFMGLTANVGYMNNHASTMYGKDNFNTINSGIAAKFGNNFEYKRLIMQPSMLLGYTFVNTFDYTTASDVRVKSNPLHAIILQPGIKLIANTESGWQPYFGANVVWNIMGQSKVRANDIYLPELSVKPYAQYGVGIQKIWNDRFSCFVQAMVRSGGRTGIDFSAGLNIAVGKDYKKDAL